MGRQAGNRPPRHDGRTLQGPRFYQLRQSRESVLRPRSDTLESYMKSLSTHFNLFILIVEK